MGPCPVSKSADMRRTSARCLLIAQKQTLFGASNMSAKRQNKSMSEREGDFEAAMPTCVHVRFLAQFRRLCVGEMSLSCRERFQQTFIGSRFAKPE